MLRAENTFEFNSEVLVWTFFYSHYKYIWKACLMYTTYFISKNIDSRVY